MTKAKEMVFSAVHSAVLVDMLAEDGVDRIEILRGTQLASRHLEDAEQLVSFDQFLRIVENGIALTGDPSLGLRLGRRLNISGHGYLGWAALSSTNIYMALQIITRYARILAPFQNFSLEWADEDLLIKMEYTVTISRLRQALTDVAYGTFASAIQALLPAQKLEMCFYCDTSAPADTTPYDRELIGPVVWDAGWNGCKISREVALSPIMTANPLMVRQTEKRLAEFLKRLGSKSESILPAVRRIVRENPGQIPVMEEIADRLHLSPRTLNRRLREIGTTYKDVVAEVRRGMAIDYLRAGHLSVDEISDLLGYRNPSNFGKAFKSWTGYSPTQYKATN